MIKTIREKAGLSQAEFGVAISAIIEDEKTIAQSTVSAWESTNKRDRRYPKRKHAQAIMEFNRNLPRSKRVTGVSLDKLLA